MTISRQRFQHEEESPVAGTLLLAHPSMLDPNFHRTVVFLAANDAKEGSLGLVMNRPMHTTLGEYDASAADSPLANVPLFRGGPVATGQLVLAAWRWEEAEGTFQLYFGLDNAKAEKLLLENKDFHVRGFMGHAGWSEGQLSTEIQEGAWLLSRCLPELMHAEGEAVWRQMIRKEHPALSLLVDAPDDPSLN